MESLIGPPNPNLKDSMEREHCHSTDSTQLFHTSNYGLDTRSDIEYYFVVDPEAGRKLAEDQKMIHPNDDSKRWWPANRTNTTATSNRTPIEGATAVAGVHSAVPCLYGGFAWGCHASSRCFCTAAAQQNTAFYVAGRQRQD